MILDPLSIATGGYIGIGPGSGDFCPLPLAIASDGYIRFDVEPEVEDPFGGGKGHGAVIVEPRYETPASKDMAQIALLAVIAIDEFYE